MHFPRSCETTRTAWFLLDQCLMPARTPWGFMWNCSMVVQLSSSRCFFGIESQGVGIPELPIQLCMQFVGKCSRRVRTTKPTLTFGLCDDLISGLSANKHSCASMYANMHTFTNSYTCTHQHAIKQSQAQQSSLNKTEFPTQIGLFSHGMLA